MRRKRSLIRNGASKENGTSHKDKLSPERSRNRNRPWPVEATVLAGISTWIAVEACRYDRDYLYDIGSHKYRMWSVSSILTAASSLISCCFVWWKCRTTSAPSSAPIGADTNGVVIGSTLVPLLFCSTALFTERYTLGVNPRIDFLEPFALASSVTSLIFAMSSALIQGRKRGNTATKHMVLTSCILFVITKVIMVAKNYGVLLNGEAMTTVVLPGVGLQAMLIYLYSRPNSRSIYAAFTPGEWCCVVQLLTSLVLGFLSINIEPTRPKLNDSEMHLAIAHGGIVGCIIGCVLSNVVHVVAKKRIHSKAVMLGCAMKLVVIVSVTVACVEIVARRWDAVHEEALSIGRFIPMSLRWLFFFLCTPDESMSNAFQNTPRFAFLIYWLIVLSLAAFPAHRMASYLRNLPISAERRRLVVVSRKYFHFVAVLLFLPPTLLAPTMMSLSYAVALSVLLLVETMRTTILSVHNRLENSSINQFYEAFLDEKDAMARSSGQLSQGKRADGVFVVTHMAMIFGCAFPLWVNEVVQKVTGPDHMPSRILSLLPAMGIIVLGVGDAVGAIVGVYLGSHKWPGTKRTIEGSLGMFLSMVLSVMIISFLDPAADANALAGLYASPQLLVLTLLEAFTSQIDNLCLPFAASILCLVGGGGGSENE